MSKLRISDFLKKPTGEATSSVFKVSTKVGKMIDNHSGTDESALQQSGRRTLDTNNPVLYHKQYIQNLGSQEALDDYYLNIFDTLPKYINTSSQIHNNISADNSANCGETYFQKIDTTAEIQLRNDYFRIVDPCKVEQSSLVVRNHQICSECNKDIEVHNGLFTCLHCGHVMEAIDYQYSYRDTIEAQIKTQFSYKKSARFIDLLRSLQAKDNSDIPKTVIDSIQKQIDMEMDFNVHKDLTITRVKEYLKRCGYNKYYDQAPTIIYRITGKAPIELTAEQEQLILSMFSEVVDHFEMAKQRVNSTRSSFLSYTYVLYKCFEILDLKEEMQVVTILKSSEKIAAMDTIWKVIVDELGWPFYRTI